MADGARDHQYQELYNRLRMGKEVEEFVSGHPIGKDMFDWAVRYAEEGWRKFVQLDPNDPDFVRKCRALHAEAQFPERFMKYVDDRIRSAKNAEEQLRYEQQADRPNPYND